MYLTHIHTWVRELSNDKGEYVKECSNCHVRFLMDKQDVVIGVSDRRQHGRRQGDKE